MTKHETKFAPVTAELTTTEHLRPKYDRAAKSHPNPPSSTHAVYSARVETEVKEEAEQWARESGWTMRQLTEFAIRTVTRSLPPDTARKMMLDLH